MYMTWCSTGTPRRRLKKVLSVTPPEAGPDPAPRLEFGVTCQFYDFSFTVWGLG